jgi:(1->4)-alpha-D-glucan 1-alpha-D-glucosylmutase
MYTPTATYRIQLCHGFNFSQLSDILPYLYELGISTIYASPVTRAVPGSEHGYDVTNPLELNPEIGTPEAWESITSFLKDHNMGWVQDIVPNHMAYSTNNPWIYDVLERGRRSDFYSFFDIIPQSPARSAKIPQAPIHIMLPFLEKELRDCVNEGNIQLVFGAGGFFFRYKNQVYPVATSTYDWICAVIPELFLPLLAWADKAGSFAFLPWHEWIYFKKEMFDEIWNTPRLKDLGGTYCNYINQDPHLLEELLFHQHYQLCSWKTSLTKMNYRRFFAVNSLICLRMEDENVFSNWHPLLYSLYNNGLVQGFRVDHIDGLFDPEAYLKRLRALVGADAYIITEKILQENEETIPSWPVQGTTGYDFLSFVNQLLTDHSGKQKLKDYFNKQISEESYDDLVFDKKWAFLNSHLEGELNNLMRWLTPLILKKGPGLSPENIKKALAVLMAAFPVYRIYADKLPLSETDQHWVDIAFAKATGKSPESAEALAILRPLFNTSAEDESAKEVLYFLRRWAQYTAPLAAKGTEDTAFYNYNVLIGHNEVGDSPGHSIVDAEKFHELMKHRQQKAGLSLNATSTHDTKRGEDNRLRINLISLFADEWISLNEKWNLLNGPFISVHENKRSPSANDEYLIYQALLGAIPEDQRISINFRKRFDAYLTKALREEKQETNWETPNEVYEKECHDFVNQILSPAHKFLSSFLPFAKLIISRSGIFSLSQTLLKLTAPGIPDIYQGADLWDLSLVDPDNRSPVDFEFRKKKMETIILKEKEGGLLAYVEEHRAAGMQKLFLIRKILHFRRDHPGLFNTGEYIPVVSTAAHIGFIRANQDLRLLILAPLPSTREEPRLSGISGIQGRWKNVLTGQELGLGDSIDTALLFKSFPVAALLSQNH